MAEPILISKTRNYSYTQDADDFLIIRVCNSLITGKNPEGFPSLSWVVLINPHTKDRVCRRVKGTRQDQERLEANAIEIDSATVLGELNQLKRPLGDDGYYPCNLILKKANFFDRIMALWRYPEAGLRIPLQISLISLVLGVLGAFVGVAGIILSLTR